MLLQQLTQQKAGFPRAILEFVLGENLWLCIGVFLESYEIWKQRKKYIEIRKIADVRPNL